LQATFAFEVSSPYIVSKDGILFFAPSSTQAYETQIVAVNIIFDVVLNKGTFKYHMTVFEQF